MENNTARAKLGIGITIVGNDEVNSSPQQDCSIVTKVRITAMETLDIDFRVPLIDRVTKIRVLFDTLVPKLFANLNFAVQDEFAAIEVGQLFCD